MCFVGVLDSFQDHFNGKKIHIVSVIVNQDAENLLFNDINVS